MKNITEEEFDSKYELVSNHIDDDASFNGYMFETYGEEHEFVLEMAKQNRVVTIIEGDDDGDWEETSEDDFETPINMFYVSGYHWVNRIGFLITKEPITQEFEVELD